MGPLPRRRPKQTSPLGEHQLDREARRDGGLGPGGSGATVGAGGFTRVVAVAWLFVRSSSAAVVDAVIVLGTSPGCVARATRVAVAASPAPSAPSAQVSSAVPVHDPDGPEAETSASPGGRGSVSV